MKDSERFLAGLAPAWVNHWIEYGGALIVDENCDHLSISMRMDWRRKPEGCATQRKQRLWHDGWIVGRWRMLAELAHSVPGLDAAIIEHVAQQGQRRQGGGYQMVA